MPRRFTVEDLMSTALVTARADETVEEVDFEMKLADVRHIPIVDRRHHLVGIVSQRDLLRALARAGNKPVRIGDIMSSRVVTVAPGSPAADAVALLLERKIGSLPVVDEDGHLVGIVTETDFLHLARDVLARQAAPRDRQAV